MKLQQKLTIIIITTKVIGRLFDVSKHE